MIFSEKFISDYQLRKVNSKGWHVGTIKLDLYCPHCHNDNPAKLAFIFGKNVCSFHCVKCDFSCRLERFFYLIRKNQYVSQYKDVEEEEIFHKRELLEKRSYDLDIKDLPECPLPVCFRRITDSKYLDKRGCTPEIYNTWNIGITDMFKKLKGYLIFAIPENGKNVGWVARSQKSKEEIDKLEKQGIYMLRWRNSDSSDFSQIVFGLDEITDRTEVVIIVEGITSKMNTDVQLELYSDEYMKCVCTFGKKISEIQILKIAKKGINIKKVILFYDVDAVKASKQYAFLLQQYFKDVQIAYGVYHNQDGTVKDAGDMTYQEFQEVFGNLRTPFEFYNTILEKKSLV